MSNKRKKMNLVILFAFSLLSVFWVMSAQNSFCYDDITHLLTVSANSYKEIFSFWPHNAYGDRPVGVMFIKFLYDIFGLDYGCFHVALVIMHLCNTFFVFLIAERLFERKYGDNEKSFLGAIISAGFFGIWARTHMAVQWVAAIFDLLGTFWALISILFYFCYRRLEKNRRQNLVFILLFYYLAIRTKEMFLVLPLLLVVYEIWEMILDQKVKRFTISIPISLAVFILFFVRILYCKAQGSITNDINNPYYQSFNPVKLIQNLLKYCMMCFDMENPGWYYIFSISGLIGTLFLCIGLLLSFWIAVVYKKAELLLCYVAVGISIAIVLPLMNQIHILYLYFPSVFLGILLACIVNGMRLHGCVSVILMCLFLVPGLSNSAVRTKNFWIENAKTELAAWNDIENMTPPISESTIYIRNMDDVGYTPFFYAEGGICKLLFEDLSLKVEVLKKDENIKFSIPYVLCNYQDGRLIETERKYNKELHIHEVYQYLQEDGSMVLGIVPNRINEGIIVCVDGIEQDTVVGEDFVSVRISEELLHGKDSIRLNVEDLYGTQSEDYVCMISEKP